MEIGDVLIASLVIFDIINPDENNYSAGLSNLIDRSTFKGTI